MTPATGAAAPDLPPGSTAPVEPPAPAQGQRSLFGEILDWMLAPLLLLWPMSVALTWLVAQNIAHRPYDRELEYAARSIAREVAQSGLDVNADGSRLPDSTALLLRTDDSVRAYFQVLGTNGELLVGDAEIPVPPQVRTPLGELELRDDDVLGEPVRVAYLRVAAPSGGAGTSLEIQVAETMERRSRLATEIIKGVILPQFVILPVAVLLVWFALARGIAPLNALQKRIRRRESQDLSPIDEMAAPEEVAPLVRSINDLLSRLDHSMGRQKHFLADAAHQLKTPLAGLRMQAELAQRDLAAGGDPQQVAQSLQQIALSSQRAAHMVNQLLSMARAEDDEQARQQTPFSLVELAMETVRDFVPRAMERRIDLGYEGPMPEDEPAGLRGQPLLVNELVRNLVDNALQYTPEGGTVTVRVTPDPFGQVLVLQVEDNGPGIPEAERELVFRPFYRALGTKVDGSGLGLAIVQEIAERHGAQVKVDAARTPHAGEAPGTLFTVRFPLQATG